jgi:dihydrofolate synthase / folylpolyglutamate synthase
MRLTDRAFTDSGTAAINWIYSSYNRAKPYISHGLDRDTRHPEWTGRLLDARGRPDAGMYNIAVTGSKGKGSHAILIAAMLQKMGFRVGLFTGPHLVNFMERFRLNGQIISEEAFVTYVDELKVIVEEWNLPANEYFGPVGLLAVVAAKWFADSDTDVNVFELGRGALHDDVNQIQHIGAVLTPVFLEHTKELGPTYADVGMEKSGVITHQTRWAFTHPQTATVQAILESRCAPSQSLFTLGDDIKVKGSTISGRTCAIDVQTGFGEFQVLLPAAEYHLADNVAVALAVAQRAALDKHPHLSLPARLDMTDLSLPGRLQTVSEHPRVVVDGTIHGRSAVLVRNYVREFKRIGERRGRVGAIIGIPADKDGAGVLKTLADEVDYVVICKAHNPHLQFDATLETVAHGLYADVTGVQYLEDALLVAHQKLGSEDLLLVLGTQSLVGDAMRTFAVDTTSIWRKPSLMETRG